MNVGGIRPLSGLRVVDCSRGLAGPRASGLLADFGADVVWVEPRGGDPWREHLAVEYAVTNRGKRSVVLDLQSSDGRQQLEGLLGVADVFISSFRPSDAEQYGLAYGQLHERFPSLVCCSITGFGMEGPLRDIPGYEAIVHCHVGSMSEQYGTREGPVFQGLPFASAGAAYLGTLGTLAALYRRGQDGHGRHVETSLFDGALAYLGIFWGETDNKAAREVNWSSGSFLPAEATRMVTGYFRCADDEYIGVHTGAVGAFGRLMTVLGLDDRIPPSADGMDIGKPLTEAEAQVLNDEVHGIFGSKTRDAWVKLLLDADVCGIPIMNPTECFDELQPHVVGAVTKVPDPKLGVLEQVARPVTFNDQIVWCADPAPGLGEDTAEVFANWVSGPRDEVPWLGTGPLDDRPLLADVKILDAGAYIAGPAAARNLADFGADVIKLETLAGDMVRGLPRAFQTAQCGKRSISMDLKDPSLAEARDRLIRWADLIHHNMRPGAAERLGLGVERVRAIKPEAIYGYAPGWGPSGPYAQRQSFEPMQSGYVGAAMEAAGQFNPPVFPVPTADPGNGLAGALGMLLSLLHFQRTGEALYFQNPQLSAAMICVSHIVRRDDGTVLNAAKLDPLQSGFSALERLYETHNGWICIVALRAAHIEALGRALHVDILNDERFATPDARRDNDYELFGVLSDAIGAMETNAVLERLLAAGVPAAVPVMQNNTRFMRDPEQRRLRRVGEHPHPTEGHVRDIDQLIRVSDAQVRPFALAPELGEHSEEILASLGYAPETIEELRDRGVIRQHEHVMST